VLSLDNQGEVPVFEHGFPASLTGGGTRVTVRSTELVFPGVAAEA
jgi:hypothetical protein